MRKKPDTCLGCPFHDMGTDFSAIEGTGSNGVFLCGEASGEMEAREGTPFVRYAPAGSLLERSLRRMGMSREQFSVSNVCRCRPRNNWLEGNPHEYSALNHCRPNLEAAIAERRPRCIVALGGVALRELTGMTGTARGISHLAGYVLPSTAGRKWPAVAEQKLIELGITEPNADAIPVIANFHPAFLRRGRASHQGIFARILRRAVEIAAGRDTNYLWNIDPEDLSRAQSLRYNTRPTVADAVAYSQRVLARSQSVLSFDLETEESVSLDEDAREGFADTHIRLVQFATDDQGAIAIPWRPEFLGAITALLHSPNTKCGHNCWLFDNKVLRAAGEREGIDLAPRGVIHDTLQMFHHWQPDLPAHLQFCAQFVSFPFPWKHLAGTDIAFYGCADVDATLRLYTFLEAALRKDGTFGDATLGYLGQVYSVRPVLEQMERRGMPIDDVARLALDVEFTISQRKLGEEIAEAAPDTCKRVHPKEGYKGVPLEVKAFAKESGIDVDALVSVFNRRYNDESDDSGEWYHYEQREFAVPSVDSATGDPVAVPTLRWCRVYDFNANSSQQLLAYMKARKHKPPKGKQENEDGTPKDTTAKKELQRLAHRTGDTFYLKVIEYREFTKMRGTYIEGFKPGPDGRVHTTFTFGTGTGQLSARNPNVTNFPKRMRLAKQIRKIVAAPPDHILVEWDYKSYHVVTTGYCAEDASYIRLAKIDMHSFVAWHMLKLPGADALASLPDAELAEKLAWFKSDEKRKWVRDNQSKPAILGIGFGMGYRRLYQENMEYFSGEKDAKHLHDLLRALFPKVFVWQDQIRQQAHQQQYLRSPFGHLRRFYEVFAWKDGAWHPGDQAEEAVAFLPANIAFGNIRETMKKLAWWKFDSLYGLINYIHDSFLFCFPAKWLYQHIKDVYPVLTAPSQILVNPVAPNGLMVDVEGVYGTDWSAGKQIEVPSAAVPVLSSPGHEEASHDVPV